MQARSGKRDPPCYRWFVSLQAHRINASPTSHMFDYIALSSIMTTWYPKGVFNGPSGMPTGDDASKTNASNSVAISPGTNSPRSSPSSFDGHKLGFAVMGAHQRGRRYGQTATLQTATTL